MWILALTIVVNAIGGGTIPLRVDEIKMNSELTCNAFRVAYLADPNIPNSNRKIESAVCIKKE